MTYTNINDNILRLSQKDSVFSAEKSGKKPDRSREQQIDNSIEEKREISKIIESRKDLKKEYIKAKSK